MTAVDTIEPRALAAELNVSLRMVLDFVRAGHLTTCKGRVTRESADELRWKLACAVAEGREGGDSEPETLVASAPPRPRQE